MDFNGKDSLPGRVFGIMVETPLVRHGSWLNSGKISLKSRRYRPIPPSNVKTGFQRAVHLFTRIVAISYSAFDRFKRPRRDTTSSYVYCGIRNKKGNLSQTSLIEAYRRKNQQRIRDRVIQTEWTDYMQRILGDSSESMSASLEKEIADPTEDDQALSLLSSGQSILCHFVTSLLAWIQPNSLVLFDEPETHLIQMRLPICF